MTNNVDSATNLEPDEDEYQIWKQNSSILYNFIRCEVTEWPSITCEWLKIMETEYIITGTHKSARNDHNNEIIMTSIAWKAIEDIDIPCISVHKKLRHDGTVNRVRNSNVTAGLIATQSSNNKVYVYNLEGENKTPLSLEGQLSQGYGLSWNPNSNKLLSSSYDHSVFLWDVEACSSSSIGTAMACYSFHTQEVGDADWNRENSNIFASVADDKQLLIWDTRSTKIDQPVSIVKHAHDSGINAVSFNLEIENLLATGSSDKFINIWDMRKLTNPVHNLQGHKSDVLVVRWCPMTPSVLASCGECRVNVWDLTRVGETQSSEDAKSGVPELLFSHSGHREGINDLAWSPVDQWSLCSVSNENALHLWQPSPSVVENDDDFELDL